MSCGEYIVSRDQGSPAERVDAVGGPDASLKVHGTIIESVTKPPVRLTEFVQWCSSGGQLIKGRLDQQPYRQSPSRVYYLELIASRPIDRLNELNLVQEHKFTQF